MEMTISSVEPADGLEVGYDGTGSKGPVPLCALSTRLPHCLCRACLGRDKEGPRRQEGAKAALTFVR